MFFRYNTVLNGCCLRPDLAILPNGDLTEVCFAYIELIIDGEDFWLGRVNWSEGISVWDAYEPSY